jgi:hypothetical protein
MGEAHTSVRVGERPVGQSALANLLGMLASRKRLGGKAAVAGQLRSP